MAAMLFVFTSIRLIIPVPVGIIGLYVFRKFECNTIKALFISDILQVIFLVFAFFDIFVMFVWVFSVMEDCVISAMIMKDSFTFKNITLFNIGGITVLPFACLSTMFALEIVIMPVVFVWSDMMILLEMGTYTGIVMAFLITYCSGGIAMLIGFKIVKEILDRIIIKVEIFDKIIGGSIMYKKNDEKGGCLNVFRNV
jgi:hypothetical protein